MFIIQIFSVFGEKKFCWFWIGCNESKIPYRIRLARKLSEICHIENGKTFSTESHIKHSYFLRKYW